MVSSTLSFSLSLSRDFGFAGPVGTTAGANEKAAPSLCVLFECGVGCVEGEEGRNETNAACSKNPTHVQKVMVKVGSDLKD